jgi:AmmeMemoRadiSam system protein B
MRYPAVAGQFYAGSESELKKQIEECFKHPLGPGEIPQLKDNGERKIRGAVVPHAGFVYSGPVAAHVYSALAKDGFPDAFIILGPKHMGMGSPIALTTEKFNTPLGDVDIDMNLANELITGTIDNDIFAHRNEHSIEVQLPFLQFIKGKLKFVPICLGIQTYKIAKEVGEIIAKTIEGKDVVVLASTDFSHYVPKDLAAKKDKMAIDAILNLDAKGLFKVVQKQNISMCGFGPVMAMIEAVKASNAELLKYATSGDVAPMRDVVGYGAIILK